jgi:hypothetical protein
MKLNINESKTIAIYSKAFWNETDLEISNEEEYRFEASGLWKDFFVKCEADGYTCWLMSLFNSWKRSPDNNWFALIGCLNKTNDFLIGKQNQISFNQNGKLHCYANDAKRFYSNNFGQISLKITRTK